MKTTNYESDSKGELTLAVCSAKHRRLVAAAVAIGAAAD
jgi:hypothetical protein